MSKRESGIEHFFALNQTPAAREADRDPVADPGLLANIKDSGAFVAGDCFPIEY